MWNKYTSQPLLLGQVLQLHDYCSGTPLVSVFFLCEGTQNLILGTIFSRSMCLELTLLCGQRVLDYPKDIVSCQ